LCCKENYDEQQNSEPYLLHMLRIAKHADLHLRAMDVRQFITEALKRLSFCGSQFLRPIWRSMVSVNLATATTGAMASFRSNGCQHVSKSPVSVD
jgi:hypothetical protein